MKNIISFFLIIFILNVLSCQSNEEVPKAVKVNFNEKYPNENDPDWHKDQNGNFESNFKKDGKHYRADFSPTGEWIETELSIEKDDLPDAVKKKLKESYDDLKIVEIEEVQHATKGLFYDVEFKKDGDKHDVEFDKAGNVIN